MLAHVVQRLLGSPQQSPRVRSNSASNSARCSLSLMMPAIHRPSSAAKTMFSTRLAARHRTIPPRCRRGARQSRPRSTPPPAKGKGHPLDAGEDLRVEDEQHDADARPPFQRRAGRIVTQHRARSSIATPVALRGSPWTPQLRSGQVPGQRVRSCLAAWHRNEPSGTTIQPNSVSTERWTRQLRTPPETLPPGSHRPAPAARRRAQFSRLYVTTMKRDLEARGLIPRVPGMDRRRETPSASASKLLEAQFDQPDSNLVAHEDFFHAAFHRRKRGPRRS